MSVEAEAAGRFRTLFDETVSALPGDSGLRDVRRRALDAFVELGFPSNRDEDWKYTSLKPIAKRSFTRYSGGSAIATDGVADHFVPGLEGQRMVFVNGRFDPALSDGSGASSARLARSLETRGSSLLEPLAAGRRFSGLNTAFVEDGAHIEIPAGTTWDEPLYLVFVSAAASSEAAVHPRVILNAGANSSVTVIEHHVGLGEAGHFNNAVTQIECGPGARVEHYNIQQGAPSQFHIQTIEARVRADAVFVSHNIGLGSALARTDIQVDLGEPGAETALNGLFMPKGRQHIDNHTRIDHSAPHTRSVEDYRGVLNDHGRGVFNGKVVVHKDAQKIDAQQSNSNLVLSEHAEVDTKPELEIYADDVKCSHGATVGQLDKDALFYLLSRGIDSKTARDLLTYAFAADVVSRMNIPAVRHWLEHSIAGRLPDSDRIKEFV